MEYKVLFSNANKVKRLIGTVTCGEDSHDDAQREAFKIIYDFCKKNYYTIPYVRLYYDNDQEETHIDVGSWTEFFAIKPHISTELLFEVGC